MTALLQKAISAAEKLTEPTQDWLGEQWLQDIESADKHWEEVISQNADKADQLEALILSEIEKGDFESAEKFFSEQANITR